MPKVSFPQIPSGWEYLFSKVLSFDWWGEVQRIRRKSKALSILALQRKQKENIFKKYSLRWRYLSPGEKNFFSHSCNIRHGRSFCSFVANNDRREKSGMSPVVVPDFPINYGVIVQVNNTDDDSIFSLSVANGQITLTRPYGFKIPQQKIVVAFPSPVRCYLVGHYYINFIEKKSGWSIKRKCTAYYVEGGVQKTKTEEKSLSLNVGNWWAGASGLFGSPPPFIPGLYKLKVEIIYHNVRLYHHFWELDFKTYHQTSGWKYYYPDRNNERYLLPRPQYQNGVNVAYQFTTGNPSQNKIFRGFPPKYGINLNK